MHMISIKKVMTVRILLIIIMLVEVAFICFMVLQIRTAGSNQSILNGVPETVWQGDGLYITLSPANGRASYTGEMECGGKKYNIYAILNEGSSGLIEVLDRDNYYDRIFSGEFIFENNFLRIYEVTASRGHESEAIPDSFVLENTSETKIKTVQNEVFPLAIPFMR